MVRFIFCLHSLLIYFSVLSSSCLINLDLLNLLYYFRCDNLQILTPLILYSTENANLLKELYYLCQLSILLD